MAFNVAALTDYTEQNESMLVMKSLFGARTQEIIQAEGNIQTGIKSSETVNILDTDATFQTGGTCGFLSSGTTTFSQRTLTVGKIKVNEALCPKALEAKYTQKALQIGSRYENIPFEQQYTDLKSGTIAEQMEIGIWQGDTASANANLNKFDGLIKIVDASGAAAQGNPTGITTGTGITTSNVRGIVSGMYLALPANVQGKKDVRVFCGWDTFQKFISAYTDANLFNFAPKGSEISAENGEVIIPGTFYKLTAVHGLDGTNRLFAMRTSNMYFGTDLENEEERWEIFFAKEADEIRFVAEWKAGVQVAFPNEIVSFKLV
jgi:hypothetical protein